MWVWWLYGFAKYQNRFLTSHFSTQSYWWTVNTHSSHIHMRSLEYVYSECRMAIIPFAIASSLVFINFLIRFICILNWARVCQRMHSSLCFLLRVCVCLSELHTIQMKIKFENLFQRIKLCKSSQKLMNEHWTWFGSCLRLEIEEKKKTLNFFIEFWLQWHSNDAAAIHSCATDAPKSLNPN